MCNAAVQATSTGGTAGDSSVARAGLEQQRERGRQQSAATTWTAILRVTGHTTVSLVSVAVDIRRVDESGND